MKLVAESMAGVLLAGGLDPPPGGGGDFLLLPDPDGGVLNHGGGAQHLPGELRGADNQKDSKLVPRVSGLSLSYT